mgnify:CR=1 FL=1
MWLAAWPARAGCDHSHAQRDEFGVRPRTTAALGRGQGRPVTRSVWRQLAPNIHFTGDIFPMNLSRLDLNLLVYLDVLLAERNVSRAIASYQFHHWASTKTIK